MSYDTFSTATLSVVQRSKSQGIPIGFSLPTPEMIANVNGKCVVDAAVFVALLRLSIITVTVVI